MKKKKIPLRTCIVSNEKLPKQEMIRIVVTKDKKVFVDESGKIAGRGVYLKKENNILDKAIKTGVIERKLEVKIDDNIYDELRKIIND